MIFIICPQARLNEIITSGAKGPHCNEFPPWMVDGAGLPSNAYELLPKLVITLSQVMISVSNCFKVVTDSAWIKCHVYGKIFCHYSLCILTTHF